MSPAVTLWGHWTCPFVNRVDWALGQRDIDHDLVPVPPSAVRPADFVLPDEFVAHSPKLEVPMVRIDGEFQVDSIPLLFWLEEHVEQAPLLPADREDLIRERVTRLDDTLMKPMYGIAYGTEDEKIDRAVGRLADAFAEMADWLAADDWLAGPAPTLVDAIAAPIHLRLPGLMALGFDRPIPDAVAEHRTRLLDDRGGRHVAWTDDQAAEYLGRHRKFRRLNG